MASAHDPRRPTFKRARNRGPTLSFWTSTCRRSTGLNYCNDWRLAPRPIVVMSSSQSPSLPPAGARQWRGVLLLEANGLGRISASGQIVSELLQRKAGQPDTAVMHHRS